METYNGKKIVARYHKVNIYESCGYYYPEVNGDAEFKTIKEAKEWIEDVYLFVKKSMEELSVHMGVPANTLMDVISSGRLL